MSLTTVTDTGRSDNRVDIVFLGDGYTAGEIDTVYQDHINGFLDYVFSESPLTDPFHQYKSFFNVHYVATVSNESGVDDPNGGVVRDTLLDGSYNFDGVTDRLLYVNTTKADTVLNDALIGTDVDAEMKLVVTNSTKYGGGGGSYAVYSGGNALAYELALHELGHSFAHLADEYDYGGPSIFAGADPLAPNSTTDPTGTKWSHWLGFDDPNVGVVGTFEGSSYSEFGVFRPTFDSKMRNLNRAFDPIAKEAFVLQFYQFVDPLDDWTGRGGSMALFDPDALMVDTIDDTVIDIEWRIDGQIVGGDQSILDLSMLNLAIGTYTITARAYDNTGLVRINLDQVEQTVSWTVTINNPLVNHVLGTDNPETLPGSTGIDIIDALAGDDTVTTYEDNDVVFGRQGDDEIDGGLGDDRLFGGQDNDYLFGNGGNDSLHGEAGADRMFGGTGDDFMRGGWMGDWMYGGADNDHMLGEEGNDHMFGGQGMDLMFGGSGNDILFGSGGNDFLGGGTGDDALRGEDGSDFLSGETGNDTMTGGSDPDRFIFRENFGLDLITDFEVGTVLEVIDLRQVASIVDLTDLYTNHMFQVGADVEIRDGPGNVITVQNTTLADLQDGNDFLL